MTSKTLERARLGIGIAGALLLASCAGAQQAAGSDKAGGDADPIVLTFADGTAGLYYNDAVQFFVDQVEELSDGELQVEVSSGWGQPHENLEQMIVHDVAAGEADLAWVWTHAFDTLDIDAFRALNAPMLIDSYPLQQAVIASDIPGEMLAGLDTVGVTGLVVVADGLHKPIAVDHPLVSPADFEGINFTTRRSTVFADAVLALGADTDVAISEARTAGLQSGAIQGYEMNLLGFRIGEPNMHLAPYATANVNLWANPAALIANPDTLAELSDTQREWVMQAAASASEQSTDLVDNDAELVAQLCESGARFADASDADLAAMSEAFEPVYASLEQDAQTAEFIARIEELKAATDPGPALEVPADCTGVSPLAVPAATSDAQATQDQNGLNGVYRFEFTDDELRELGVDDPAVIAFNHGVYTWTLADGTWEFDQIGEGVSDHHEGTYEVAGDAVSFAEEGLDTLEFTWERDANGSIRLTPTAGDPQLGAQFAFNVWERIDSGDASNEPQEVALDGTYRWTLTTEDALAHGTANQTPEELATFPWVLTVTLDDGRWTMLFQSDSEEWIGCDSVDCLYTVDGNRIVFDGEPGGYVSEFTFSSDENGNLQLQAASADAGAVFVMTTKPWERIN
jgi:TRAP-type C4-dicarboxylate transport system substrate-binding protein